MTTPLQPKKLILAALVVIGMGLLLFSGTGFPVRAQDDPTPTATPDWGEIRSIGFHSALPTLLRFRVRVMVPHDEVERVTLTITQEDGVDKTLDLDLEDSIFIDFESEIEYEYKWYVIDEPGLKLFQPLTYHFEVETASGTVSTAEEEVLIEHQGIGIAEWQSAEQDFVTLYWASNRVVGEAQVENLADMLELLQEQTDFDTPLTIALYDPDTQICQEVTDEETGDPTSILISDGEEFPCDPDDLFALYQRNDITAVVLPDVDFQVIANLLAETVVNSVYGERWDGTDVPAWFVQGLPVLYTQGRPRAVGIAQRAAQEERLLRLGQMNEMLPEDARPVEVDLWNAQAYLFTLYLAEVYGAEAPFDVALAINEDVSFSEALATVTDDSIEQLYRAWVVWLTTARVEQAAQWNPYQPITPTPSPTVTFSPVPPTRTPRPTPTITLTPTRVPFFIPSPEIVTRAPPTIRPTVSNTPLPPGALNTAVPPAPVNNNSDESNGLCGTGIGAMLLPAVGLVLSRRKRYERID